MKKNKLEEKEKDKEKEKEKKIQRESTYQISEAVVKIIVDKLINLSVRKSYSNKIDSEFGNYCFNYLKNHINSMFEPIYISHTIETKNLKLNSNANKNDTNIKNIFWKTKAPVNNTWTEIIEPKYFEIDRFEGSNIKFKEIEKNDEEKELQINKKKINNTSPKTKNPHQKSNFTRAITKRETRKNSNIDNVIIDKRESNKNISLINNNNIINANPPKVEEKIKENTINNKSNNLNKNKKMPIVDFPYEDIPNLDEDNVEKYDLPNVEFLRKEYQESLIKKEEENKKIKNEEEKEKKIQKIFNEKKNLKIIDSNKLTFDSDGKIISFRPYRLDNLKDFILTKNFIKDFKKNDNLNTGQKSPRKSTTNKTPSKITKAKKEEKEEEIIRNTPINKDKLFKIIDIKPIEKIIPSGNNFHLISPDVGVVIKDNGQLKEGSREFNKHFKKYSLQDYDKMLNDYLPNMNKKFLKTSFGSIPGRQSLRNNVLNINNIIKNKQSEIIKRNSKDININNIINNSEEVYNPLISSQNKENSLLEKDINNSSTYKTLDIQNNNMLSTIRYNNPLLSSYNNNSSNINNNLYTTNFDKFITMKKGGVGSLKLELDSLKDLSEINHDGFYKNSLTTRYNDIIGEKFRIKNNSHISRNMNTKYKNEFGDFNKRILTNKRWGNEISNNNTNNNLNTVYSKHQTKIQILRELGSNILNGVKIKLPRDRKVNLPKNN